MLDAEELAYINKLFEEEKKEYLLSISSKVKELFIEAIKFAVYDYYTPSVYERMYRLLDNVDVRLTDDDSLFIHLDLNEGLGYSSAVTGAEVSQYIADFIIEGHQDNTNIMDQYHKYEPRKILEIAKQLIQTEFPDLKVEIENSENNIISFV